MSTILRFPIARTRRGATPTRTTTELYFTMPAWLQRRRMRELASAGLSADLIATICRTGTLTVRAAIEGRR